ncbi:amidohydrolase family protein [Sphingomonas sp. MG17]|uniref:Amidohydrolase family protein n=1 Tax=Sphingomonas tagetis TaxID=2949092 RepID=A0A9X2KQ53_9SPHN|nr:amidohydrolase family protein [Sphingomonas tagetis]MCP3731383.1 amidohydrolase family protein [Sphingomonas tagetis]
MAIIEPEAALFPDLPVIDSQHHLVDRVSDAIAPVLGLRRFLIDDYVEYLGTGHNVVASIAVEGRAMYRAAGPRELRPVGETEFLNGQAAMAASGLYGPCQVGAGIVGHVDFRVGKRVREVLDQHVAAAPQRFRGARQSALWDADPSILGDIFDGGEGLYRQLAFIEGFRHFAPLGFTFDAFVLAPQLADVIDLAHRFPDTQIVLDHVGQPIGVGAHAGRMGEEYLQWRRDMVALAACENVAVKLGGLGSFLGGAETFRADLPATSERLASDWRPYVEVAIELFGAHRCMFESNRPTDDTAPFGTICNAFKRITAGCSDDERRDIFAGTAKRIYQLEIQELPPR